MDAALLRALWSGSLADVLDCVANGACATAANERGCSALHIASLRPDACAAEALVRSGASANARDHGGSTPLHWCRAACCALLLLSAGADVDAVTIAGWTPLHSAACRGVVDCAVQLLAAGADPGATNRHGETPADVAARHRWPAMASLLRDAAAVHARWAGLRRAALTAWCSRRENH